MLMFLSRLPDTPSHQVSCRTDQDSLSGEHARKISRQSDTFCLRFSPIGILSPKPGECICLALLFAFRHFVGNFVGNFVENFAEFDGLFSNINRVDKVSDEVSDEGTKG